MIKSMFSSFTKVLLMFLFVSFIYIITSQKTIISAYESGGDYNSTNEFIVVNNTAINEKTGNSELENFISCYKEPIAREDYTAEMNNKLDQIYNLFASSKTKVSFTYEDLYTGLHLSYNESNAYFAASVIKSPVVLYTYMMYLNGELDLEEILTYTPKFYIAGTGSIQYQKYGTKYTIRELIAKTILESDNIAYAMICDRVDKSNIREFWKEKGVTTFWYNNNIWGQVNSKDGAIYMKELYSFLDEHPELKEEVLGYYFNSATPLIKLNENVSIAHKSGWTSAAIHDMAIVYSEQPYVLSINSLMGYGSFNSFFFKATTLINDFHKLYWEKKSDACYSKVFG